MDGIGSGGGCADLDLSSAPITHPRESDPCIAALADVSAAAQIGVERPTQPAQKTKLDRVERWRATGVVLLNFRGLL